MDTFTAIIETKDEECHCRQCGMPLYTGDKVYIAIDGNGTFCTLKCESQYRGLCQYMHGRKYYEDTGESGQGLIEYALIVGLIALVVYMLLAWAFGTPHIANWPNFQTLLQPFERLFNDFLFRLSIFTHL